MKRTEKIEIRVSQSEKAAIIEKAGDMSLSDYLRGLALPEKCHDKLESVMTKIEPIPESVMTDTENVMTKDNSVMTNVDPVPESVMTITPPFALSVMTSLDNVMTTIDSVMTNEKPQEPQRPAKQPKPWSGGYGKAISSK